MASTKLSTIKKTHINADEKNVVTLDKQCLNFHEQDTYKMQVLNWRLVSDITWSLPGCVL